MPAKEARKLKLIAVEYRAKAIPIDCSTHIDNLIEKYRLKWSVLPEHVATLQMQHSILS